MARLIRVNVMLEEDDLAILDEHFPKQRSALLRAMIRAFIEKNINREMKKCPTS